MSTLANAAQDTSNHFVQRHPLISFFVLAIGLTWIFMITDALGSHNIIPFRLPLPLLLVMGYMPTAAAIIVTGMTRGREGVKALLRKLLIARVGLGWYLVAIFGLILVFVTAILIYDALGRSPSVPILSTSLPSLPPIQLMLSIVLLFIVTAIVNGEELGWRGFALPGLQLKHNALNASLILGVMWAVFHLPLFFTTTGSSQAGTPFLSFLISTVALSVLFSWIVNNTRGSVLMAYLFHASANTWTRVFSIDHANASLNWIVTGVMVLAAVIVVAVAGAENLSRKAKRVQE